MRSSRASFSMGSVLWVGVCKGVNATIPSKYDWAKSGQQKLSLLMACTWELSHIRESSNQDDGVLVYHRWYRVGCAAATLNRMCVVCCYMTLRPTTLAKLAHGVKMPIAFPDNLCVTASKRVDYEALTHGFLHQLCRSRSF
ncbi:hypothetical protein GQ53DRAFT_230604 [Thozetella sp. PMI_491]|nr:hypothetical protein GQ53DRAFT_230604 [Thozetella sp. PMI_491]